MPSEEELKNEIYDLSAQVLALSGILSFVLRRIGKSDAQLLGLVSAGFDDAADWADRVAIKHGERAASGHTVKAVRIVEELRATAVGSQK